MSEREFQSYFQGRAHRFAAFYSSEPVARVIGRGPLFDRLRLAVDLAVAIGAKRVLDMGCGSGPLFAPMAAHGIHVVGVDPAEAMVALATEQASEFPGLIEVRQGRWEDLDEVDSADLSVALGVFDYVARPGELLSRLARAAPHVIGSFPAPGVRLVLRKVRYGMRGVGVHGYTAARFDQLASAAGLEVVELQPLGRAGYVVHFQRQEAAPG